MRSPFEVTVEAWEPLIQDYLNNLPRDQADLEAAQRELHRRQGLLLASHGWTFEEFKAEAERRGRKR